MQTRFLRALGVCVAISSLILWSSAGRAEVTLPDGTGIPRDSANGETQLSTLFSNRGEAIDFIADGFPTPDTFSPLCNFKATMLLRESASDLAVGWYNVVAGATLPPAQGQIFEIFSTANNNVNATFSGDDIRADARYAGGLIGFALVRNPPHFSEAKWNTVCSSCTTPGPWILSVSYRSKQTANAYYLAFEDGNTSSSSFGNDGDYNDYVMLFEGLACAGDGEPCEVPGEVGVCKDGLSECNNTGVLECKQVIAEGPEVCDSLDNDCDGETDEGDDLCQGTEVCSRGQCVPRCGDGEFQCVYEPFTLCDGDVCVDPTCQGKECSAGEICIGGECRSPCENVVCPVGRECRLGACVDPCAGVTCAAQRTCVGGACVVDCSCTGCTDGSTCSTDTGVCVDNDCIDKSCATGTYCAPDGSCADACKDAACPLGSRCQGGECVAVTPGADAGAGGGDTGGGATTAGGGATAGGNDGASAGEADASAGSGGLGAQVANSDSGCGCRVATSEGAHRHKLLFAFGLVALFCARRQRRRA